MKSFAKLLIAALAVTICVTLGFGLAGWLKVPKLLAPLFLLPAALLFALIDRKRFNWVKLALFFLLVGVSTWLPEVLLPPPFNEHYIFVGPVLLLLFLPSLERLFDRVREKLRHNKSRHLSPHRAQPK